MITILLALLLLLILTRHECYGHNNKNELYCQGHWETLRSMEQHPYPIRAGRTPKQANNTELGYKPWDQPWFWEACPAQTTLHSCHFHGNKTHADLLERRVWVTTDPSCMEFTPLEFLELLRDRRLIILGDSLITQLWQSLVCALHGTAENKLYVHWAKMWRCNEVTCPHDEEKHSNCYGGIARFPTANVTIINKKMYKYTKDLFVSTLRRLKVTSRDIIIVNFGLHYLDEAEYLSTIESFHQEFQQNPDLSSLSVSFFETSPQHYPAKNGYFVQGEQFKNQCKPLTLMPVNNNKESSNNNYPSYLAPEDWRNLVVHKVFSKATSTGSSNMRIIPLAHGLYSQYDAHVALEPYPTPPWLDCTHWCFPSGAVRYYMLHLFNGIRRMIGKDQLNSRMAHYHSDTFAHHNQKSSGTNSNSNNNNNDLATIQSMLIGYPEGSLLRGSGRSIYIIKNQRKCEFGNFDAFKKLGLDLANVVKIADSDLDDIPTGPVLT